MRAISLVFLLLPLLLYVAAALRDRSRSVAPSEFFLAPGQISSFEFANSSIGYGFQIASVSIFLTWGYLYGLGALVNPIFWGLGILLFALMIPRMRSFLGSGKTLHGFLGERYASRGLEILASVVTLIGFLGTFVAELVWGSAVFRLVSNSPWITGAILTGMILGIVWYLIRAGQLNAMRTDQVQLVFTYTGFLALGVALLWVLPGVGQDARAMSFLLSVGLALCLGAMLLMLWRQWRLEREMLSGQRFNITRIVRPVLVGLVLCAFSSMLLNLLRSIPTSDAVQAVTTRPSFASFSFGIPNLLSLALLPLFWQLVDVTMWQRLASVRLPSEGSLGAREANLLAPIRTGLYRFALESPITWFFAILVGMALRDAPLGVTEETIWDALGTIPTILSGGGDIFGSAIATILALLFGAAIVAAMLSTSDSMLMGALAVFSLDIASGSAGERTAKEASDIAPRRADAARTLLFGRLGICVFAFAGLVIIWVQLLGNTRVLPILLGAYAAQISLAPAVVGALLLRERRVHRAWPIASVVAGVLASAIATAIALNDATWQLYAPLFALGASVPVYLLGVIVNLQRAR